MSAVILSGGSVVGSSGAVYLLQGGGGGSGFYPAGHWLAAKMSMQVIHPRPDSDTGTFATTFARHRLAFYDGTNAVPYQVPVAVQGGARPLVWSVITGPSGMTVGGAYGTANYGVVTWQPTASISTGSPTTVTIRATDQQLNTIDLTWTVATSSSTTDFIFVNSVTGNDSTGTGTFALPYATLAKVMGTNTTSTTFPKARIYMSGSLQWPTQTGATAGYFQLDRSKVPIVYMTLPGSSTNIDATLVQLSDNGSGCSDLYFSGSANSRTAVSGSATAAADTHTFELYNPNRCTWWNVDFQNPINQANGSNTNSTTIFTSNSGIVKSYYLILGCTETGRSGAAGNSMLMTSMFSVNNIVFEANTISGTAGFGVFFKDSNQNLTCAYNSIQLLPESTSNGTVLLFGCQHANETPGNLEACYNLVLGGALIMSFQGFTPAGAQWSYRNTICDRNTNYPAGLFNFGSPGDGPFSSESDVIVSHTNVYGSPTPEGGQAMTETGTEVQLAWTGSFPPSNCPVNTTTGALVNATTAWRTLYLGIRGWEIA